MKKITNSSLAGIAFAIEEDAYEVLKTYLSAIEAHFTPLADGKEVLADIESGIAEKLTAELKTPHGAVSLPMIERVIADMGRVEDIIGADEELDGADSGAQEDPADEKKSEKKSTSTAKRLFRDTDNAILGGVATGIANYFSVDPTFVRLAFVVGTFFSGFGALVYIVLWVIVPPARTTTQRYQMRGEQVTLAGIAERMQEEVENLRAKDLSGVRRLWAGIRVPLNAIFRAVGFLIRFAIKALRFLLGFVLMFASSVALVALVIAFLFAALNPTSPYVDVPLAEFLPGAAYYVALITLFALVAVPVLCVTIVGKMLFNGRTATKRLGLTLLGVWILAIISGALLFDPIYTGYQNARVSDTSSFRTTSEAVSPEPFIALEVEGSKRVTIVAGSTYSVELTGPEKELRDVSVANEGGVLVIEDKPDFRICLFCFSINDRVEVVVTTPGPLTNITARNSTSIMAEPAVLAEELVIRAANSSDIVLEEVSAGEVTAEARNSSHIKLTGSATALRATARNSSYVDAGKFTVNTATTEVSNSSHTDVHATKTLSGSAYNSSSVTQYGEAAIDAVTEQNSSHVNKRD